MRLRRKHLTSGVAFSGVNHGLVGCATGVAVGFSGGPMGAAGSCLSLGVMSAFLYRHTDGDVAHAAELRPMGGARARASARPPCQAQSCQTGVMTMGLPPNVVLDPVALALCAFVRATALPFGQPCRCQPQAPKLQGPGPLSVRLPPRKGRPASSS